MEEAHHDSSVNLGDDDDEEDYSMFGMKRSRIKRRTIIDEDDDEKENSRVDDNTAEKVAELLDNRDPAVGKDIVDRKDSEQEGMGKIVELSDRLFDSDNDDSVGSSDCEDSVTANAVLSRPGKTQKLLNDSEGKPGVMVCLSRDIFDAESSDEDYPNNSNATGLCDNAGDHQFDTDESRHDSDGLDMSQLDPGLLAKLKKMKGAARSGSKKRKAKTTAEDRMESYSESQRMLRDSRVSLPYYEPEPKLLDDFLARASLKRMAYAGLNQAKDIQKAKIICDKLSSPNIVSPALRQRVSRSNKDDGSVRKVSSNVKQNQSGDLPAGSDLILQPGIPSLTEKCASVDSDSDDLPDLQLPLPDAVHTTSASNVTCDSDDLPDLQLSLPDAVRTTSTSNVTCDSDPQGVNTLRLAAEPSQDVEACAPSLQIDNKPHDSKDTSESSISMCSPGQSNTTEQETASTTDREVESYSRDDLNVGHSPKDNLVSCSPLIATPSACSVPVSETPTLRTFKSSLLDRLSDLHLPALPSLSGTPDGIISLDDSDTEPVIMKPGLDRLMRRLVKHSSKKVSSAVPQVAVSIPNEDNQTLAEDSVPENPETDQCPGSKLDRLKQQLGVGMRKKRAEARHRRQQLFALENEEGFEKDAEGDRSNSEEEEAEMTEGSDTDDEDDEVVDYKLKLNVGGSASEDDNDYNPLLDEEDDDSNADVHLHFDVSEEEEDANETDGEKESQNLDRKCGERSEIDSEDDRTESADIAEPRVKTNKKRLSYLDSDDDDDEPAHVAENEHTAAGSTTDPDKSGQSRNQRNWSRELTPLSKLLQDSQHQSRFRSENSQSPDLYSTGVVEDSGRVTDSLYRSQKFDVDSILRLVQTQPRSTLSLHEDERDMEFGGSQLNMSAGKIFHDLASQPVNNGSGQIDSQEDNMQQLLGLCSGTFGPVGEIQDSQLSQIKSTQSFPVSQSGRHDDGDVYDPFHVLSDEEDVNPNRQAKRVIFSDSEDGSNESDDLASDREGDASGTDEENEASDDENDTKPAFPSDKFTEVKKKKYMRNEFLEEEAELSGSEYDSDENLDLAEEDDVLEEEEGDQDLLGVSEDKLRDQVGKLHMKQLQDDDERQVMRYKEMYLQDGDLYSEGAGRKRNFRWKDIENGSQPDLFGQHSDDEQVEDDEEVLWRRNRYEREKLVEEEELNAQSNNSQALKLGQFFVQKQESIHQAKDQVSVAPKVNQAKIEQPKELKKGSFLCRGKETLGRIAQVVKTTGTGSSSKNSRNFVFHTVGGPDTEEEKTPASEPVLPGNKRKAHLAPNTPQTFKKPKLISNATFPPVDKKSKPQLKRHCSIFELIERA